MPKMSRLQVNKTNAFKFLDKIDTSAQAVSAVNTVVNKNGKLVGYNTDIYGIEMALRELKVDISTSTFLVLGAGGAARAVMYCLARYKSPQIYLANRTYARALNLKNLIARTFPHSVIKALPLDNSHLKKIITEVGTVAKNSTEAKPGLSPKRVFTRFPATSFSFKRQNFSAVRLKKRINPSQSPSQKRKPKTMLHPLWPVCSIRRSSSSYPSLIHHRRQGA